jgi:hypothetical protein
MGLAFHPSDGTLVVTFSASSTWGWFDANTLQPVLVNSGVRELIDSTGTLGIKDPRAVLFAPPGFPSGGALVRRAVRARPLHL